MAISAGIASSAILGLVFVEQRLFADAAQPVVDGESRRV
jgi:hypothetical protein